MAASNRQDQREQVGRIARALTARYDWQLVKAEWLVARVEAQLGTLPPTAGAVDIERLCKDEVSWELFEACMRGGLRSASAGERLRQEQAYHDLYTYLTCIAQHLRCAAPCSDPGDLVQEALIAIRRDYTQCRQPHVFLEWAAQVLRNKRADSWRQFREETSLEALLERSGLAATEVVTYVCTGRDRHVDPTGDQELFRILHDCLDTDEERLLAFMGIMGLKRREIAMLFDTPLARWDRVRMAVKRKLECSEPFLALFERGQRAK